MRWLIFLWLCVMRSKCVVLLLVGILSGCGGGGSGGDGYFPADKQSGGGFSANRKQVESQIIPEDLNCERRLIYPIRQWRIVCSLPESQSASGPEIYQLINPISPKGMSLPPLADVMGWQQFSIYNSEQELFVIQTRINIEKDGAGDIEKIASIGMAELAKTKREEIDLEDRMVLRAFQNAERYGRLQKVLKKSTSTNVDGLSEVKRYAVGDKRVWHDLLGDSDTTLLAIRALPGGKGSAYVWAQDGLKSNLSNIKISTKQADAFAERFVNSVYPIESALVGEPWGEVDTSWGSYVMPPDSSDINIVISRLNSFGGKTLGYTRWINMLLPGAERVVCVNEPEQCNAVVRNSNQALALFVDIDNFIDVGSSDWTVQGKGPSLALSTMAHEYLHLIYSYNKTLRRPVGALPPSVWEGEVAAQTMAYLVSADTFTGGRGDEDNSHPDLRPNGDFSSFISQRPRCILRRWGIGGACYPFALGLGMMMLHQYGEGVLKPWIVGSKIKQEAIDDGIYLSGGKNFADLRQQLAIAWFYGVFGSGYTFPAKSISLPTSHYLPNGKVINLPAVRIGKGEVSLNKNQIDSPAYDEDSWQFLLRGVPRGESVFQMNGNYSVVIVKP
ncbi:hypothetical protein [Chromobacterium sp. CV08]|uniref:hypothetical protein n=1 Tax=Chromobacterium sp. CV08 TaxID=3133274 RepID=UPI003DA8B01D